MSILVPVAYGALVLSVGFLENSHAEFCHYVKEGQPHNATHNGDPCQLTDMFLKVYGAIMFFGGTPLQLIALVAWGAAYLGVRKTSRPD
ncbi:protein of unknown function [Magnetospira sp. QH-2]|nr:protein of unknown function [Magnetospira sp. QH-2]